MALQVRVGNEVSLSGEVSERLQAVERRLESQDSTNSQLAALLDLMRNEMRERQRREVRFLYVCMYVCTFLNSCRIHMDIDSFKSNLGITATCGMSAYLIKSRTDDSQATVTITHIHAIDP